MSGSSIPAEVSLLRVFLVYGAYIGKMVGIGAILFYVIVKFAPAEVVHWLGLLLFYAWPVEFVKNWPSHP
jgi:hypothetical protein